MASFTQHLSRPIVLVAIMCAISGVSFATGYSISTYRGLPEVLATLPGDNPDYSLMLDLRLKELFPIGSKEDSLIAFLTTQGFSPAWARRNDPRIASFVRAGLLCTKTARISWSATPEGLLTSVGGAYDTHCV